MSIEQPIPLGKTTRSSETEKLVAGFRNLVAVGKEDISVFESLENDLAENGFSLADMNAVFEILHDDSLLCRSESFSRIMSLLLEHQDVEITNPDSRANMCVMAAGNGFKTAMMEGFSGKDVDGAVKAVMTFDGENLSVKESIPRDSQLWEFKPETAKVSLAGSGLVHSDDVRMVSFRFPVRFFPENLLTEDEKDRLENGKIAFIVRHYISEKKKTVH
jgi:hypothetical protein